LFFGGKFGPISLEDNNQNLNSYEGPNMEPDLKLAVTVQARSQASAFWLKLERHCSIFGGYPGSNLV